MNRFAFIASTAAVLAMPKPLTMPALKTADPFVIDILGANNELIDTIPNVIGRATKPGTIVVCGALECLEATMVHAVRIRSPQFTKTTVLDAPVWSNTTDTIAVNWTFNGYPELGSLT